MALSAFGALIRCRCPRCRRGSMFTDSPFSLRYGRRAYVHCPVCRLHFEREPGFFEGAMYFNYALNVAIMLTSGLATYLWLGDPGQWVYAGISACMIIALVTFTSRLSKSLMLHLFGGTDYDPEAGKGNPPPEE